LEIVIVGNGVAGIEAAMTVRAREPGVRITLISEESDHFFSRTALMYVLAGQMSYRDIEPLERDAYQRLDLVRIRARAVRLEPDSHEVVLADGRRVHYDKLLLAVGSRPRVPSWPGYALRGVGHFVTLQDLQWFEQELHGRHGVDLPPNPDGAGSNEYEDSPYRQREVAAKVRGQRAQRAVVVGGGLIGIETVETLLAARVPVSFLVREEWFWPIALDERESTFIAHELRHHGVDVRLGANVQRLVGDDKDNVREVVTDQGALPTDLVIVAIGVVPNTEWLGEAVLRDQAGGILVDEQLCTSASDVWAAGDCASVRWYNGWVRPEQLWYTARDQGRVAGRAMLGDPASYRRGTWYNSAKLMDIEYTTAGLVNMKVEGEQSWFFEEKGAVHSTTRIVHHNGRVIGMNFLGRRWDHSVCNRWIEERRSLQYVLEHLREASFDTEFVPPLVYPRHVEAP
jgi:NADPH-dependent 2,4-dienoyl-CoA reductase/sulfur reductase-like enzyme